MKSFRTTMVAAMAFGLVFSRVSQAQAPSDDSLIQSVPVTFTQFGAYDQFGASIVPYLGDSLFPVIYGNLQTTKASFVLTDESSSFDAPSEDSNFNVNPDILQLATRSMEKW